MPTLAVPRFRLYRNLPEGCIARKPGVVLAPVEMPPAAVSRPVVSLTEKILIVLSGKLPTYTKRLTGVAAVTVTTAVSDFVISATEVAVTFTAAGFGIAAGAV